MSLETAIEKLAAAIEKLAIAQQSTLHITAETIALKMKEMGAILTTENTPAPPVEPGPEAGPEEPIVEPVESTPEPESTAGPEEFEDFEPGPDEGPEETVEPEKVKPPEPKVVMALLRRVAAEVSNTAAVNLLAEFGSKKFSEVPVGQYAEFQSLAKKLLGDE